ncbi:hypothetical protein B5M42_004950 [Paenibacillus athensensis]|uniref:hypothetical protein n=1 Tax=Paenibacillus athensensis TaxID=1967502 RepID=UPI001430DE68|nr:hypothetical protein [Paenibacillus athensensis]MCD1258186.1 hypothetical protein [Paenibacillus athensensis]
MGITKITTPNKEIAFEVVEIREIVQQKWLARGRAYENIRLESNIAAIAFNEQR